MKILRSLFIALPIIALTSPLVAEKIPDHYLVQLKGTASPEKTANKHAVNPTLVYTKVANGFAALVPPGKLKKLQQDPDVLSVTPDRLVQAIGIGQARPDKPGKPGGGGGGSSNEVIPEGLKAIEARMEDRGDLNGYGIGVAIGDTGLDFDHPDLKGNIAPEYCDSFGGNGQDDHGHGTHVGGIVGSIDNEIDIIGVAPQVTLYAVKMLNASGSGSDATIIEGLEWIYEFNAVEKRIHTVNLSLGRAGTVDDNPTLKTAISTLHNSGVTIVVAAGNDCNLQVSQQVPASHPDVIAVASSTAKTGGANKKGQFVPKDTESYFSTNGADVTISAPGEDQEDVSNGGRIRSVGILSLNLGGGTTRKSGTSMSTPYVTGVVALLYDKDGGDVSPGVPEAIRTAIQTGARGSGTGTLPSNSPTSCHVEDGVFEGILNAPGAISSLPLP